MKVQWSLRTLLIVMTLGGPLLAGSATLVSKVAKQLSPYEEVHPCGHPMSSVSWTEAKRLAHEVQPLGGGITVEGLQPGGERNAEDAEDSLHSSTPID